MQKTHPELGSAGDEGGVEAFIDRQLWAIGESIVSVKQADGIFLAEFDPTQLLNIHDVVINSLSPKEIAYAHDILMTRLEAVPCEDALNRNAVSIMKMIDALSRQKMLELGDMIRHLQRETAD